MKATIKSTGKVVEVVSRFMPKKKNVPSRDWMCNLSDGTCIDEKELEYIKDEPVADELEGAASNYSEQVPIDTVIWYNGANEDVYFYTRIKDAFKAGANWQKDQFEKNRLADCDKMTKEEYDRETDFALEIINKEHRQPTFSDAIEYGMRIQREQMMKGAIHYVVQDDLDSHGASYNIPFIRIGINALKPKGIGVGDKVKLIVIKEED